MRKIHNIILGSPDEFQIEQRLFNLLILLSLSFGVISVIQNIILKLPFLAIAIPILATIFLLVLYIISRFYDYYRASIWLYIILTLASLGLVWFDNGGTNAGITFTFLVLMFYFTVITSRKGRWLAMVMALAVPVVLLVLEFYNPEWVVEYPSRKTLFTDIILTFSLSMIFMGLGALLVIDNFRSERRKVERQNLELNQKNREMMESIHYAGIIQHSILPDKEKMSPYLRDLYILSMPRDVVGGDFYWFYPENGYYLVAMIDCTGHGVPGALMAMTAYTILNQVVTDYCKDNPGEILTHLNRILKKTLQQDDPNTYSNDGMDVGLCMVNTKQKRLVYAGARFTFFFQTSDELKIVSGDHTSIGYRHSDDQFHFANHEFQLSGGERIFLFTDGLVHQVGGERMIPYGYSRLKEIIDIHSEDKVTEVGNIIAENIKQYQGNQAQRDDISVLAFEVTV